MYLCPNVSNSNNVTHFLFFPSSTSCLQCMWILIVYMFIDRCCDIIVWVN
jgi:hypothetical protein